MKYAFFLQHLSSIDRNCQSVMIVMPDWQLWQS